MSEASFDYEDIVHEHRPRSTKHPPMNVQKRAAQFAPFAALKGHEAAVAETARLTDAARRPDEAMAEEIDRVLRRVAARREPTAVRVTYFEPDARKGGGRYVRATVTVKRIDTDRRELVLIDGKRLLVAALTAAEEGE